MFCCTLLYAHSSIAIILIGNRELVALLNLSSWCLMMVEWLFPALPWGFLRFVIVVFLDHTVTYSPWKEDSFVNICASCRRQKCHTTVSFLLRVKGMRSYVGKLALPFRPLHNRMSLLSFLLFLRDSEFNCPEMPVILTVS